MKCKIADFWDEDEGHGEETAEDQGSRDERVTGIRLR